MRRTGKKVENSINYDVHAAAALLKVQLQKIYELQLVLKDKIDYVEKWCKKHEDSRA